MPLPHNLFCGPCGWSYPHWNGTVYPKTRSRGFHPLEYISRYFDAVEINTTFYQSIRPKSPASGSKRWKTIQSSYFPPS